MPVTPAHPALVLPLFRFAPRWVNVTGLAVGSLSPDFEYFLHLTPIRTVGHTLPGVFFFDLPLAVAVAVAFQWLVRTPLFLHLPAPVDRRAAYWIGRPWIRAGARGALVFLISCLLGALSHLLWDGFTNAEGYFVRQWSALAVPLALGGHNVPVYRALHGISSVGGALAVVAAVIRALGEDGPRHLPTATAEAKIVFWLPVLLGGVLLGSLQVWRASWGFNPAVMLDYRRYVLIDFAVAGVAGAVGGLLLASTAYWILKRRREKPL